MAELLSDLKFSKQEFLSENFIDLYIFSTYNCNVCFLITNDDRGFLIFIYPCSVLHFKLKLVENKQKVICLPISMILWLIK